MPSASRELSRTFLLPLSDGARPPDAKDLWRGVLGKASGQRVAVEDFVGLFFDEARRIRERDAFSSSSELRTSPRSDPSPRAPLDAQDDEDDEAEHHARAKVSPGGGGGGASSAYDAFGVREGDDSDLDDSDDDERSHGAEPKAEAPGPSERRATRRGGARSAEIETLARKLDEV